jgi:two-component system, NarL family, nitrate/nitrite response regulator NarL
MTSRELRVLIVDDHQLVAEVLATHLQVLGEISADVARTLAMAQEMIEAQGGYDVVLLDLWMPGAEGLKGLETMIAANRGKPVALLSGNLPASTVKEAMRLGAASCIPKTLPAKSLINALRFIATGETFLPISTSEVTGEGERLQRVLSERERQVLEGLRLGQTNKEIGRSLSLSEVTIKMHVRAICSKLGVKNRTQAALIAQAARGAGSDGEKFS